MEEENAEKASREGKEPNPDAKWREKLARKHRGKGKNQIPMPNGEKMTRKHRGKGKNQIPMPNGGRKCRESIAGRERIKSRCRMEEENAEKASREGKEPNPDAEWRKKIVRVRRK